MLTLRVQILLRLLSIPGISSAWKAGSRYRGTEWLAHVARLGTFTKSFVPSKEYRVLRVLSRYKFHLVCVLQAEKNRFHKILVDAGYRLSLFFSDVWGVTAQHAVDGILAGKSATENMSDLQLHHRIKASRTIREALEGRLSDFT